MTVLNFPASTLGTGSAGHTKTLLALSDPGAPARIAASGTTDLLREA